METATIREYIDQGVILRVIMYEDLSFNLQRSDNKSIKADVREAEMSNTKNKYFDSVFDVMEAFDKELKAIIENNESLL